MPMAAHTSTNSSIESSERAVEMAPGLGVRPPTDRAEHSSIRDAPARVASGGVARLWDMEPTGRHTLPLRLHGGPDGIHAHL